MTKDDASKTKHLHITDIYSFGTTVCLKLILNLGKCAYALFLHLDQWAGAHYGASANL